MPSRNAHSTARPAPAPRTASGLRVPAAVREAASTAVDTALKAMAIAAADEARRWQWSGDEDAAQRAQGVRAGADEARACLRRRRALDRLTPVDDLARGYSASWRRGVEEVYARARTLYDAAVNDARTKDSPPALPREEPFPVRNDSDG